jgi:hypothetical protein
VLEFGVDRELLGWAGPVWVGCVRGVPLCGGLSCCSEVKSEDVGDGRVVCARVIYKELAHIHCLSYGGFGCIAIAMIASEILSILGV